MFSYWHSTILGRYNPQDRLIGLDFRNLFLDPLATRLTHVHELTHSILSRSTEFGQTTEAIFQLLPRMKHLSFDEKEQIRNALMNAQVFTQEGTASLMELLRLSSEIGKKEALKWARDHFAADYFERVSQLAFVLEMGQRYRDCFTEQIPHTAMHTGLKSEIIKNDFLSKPKEFIEYLNNEKSNPDSRYKKMISEIKFNTFIPTKEPREICNLTNVEYFDDVTKKDAADFLNYLHKLANTGVNVMESQIRDIQDINVMSEANDDIIIANMNLDLVRNGQVLWQEKDLVHYKDKIEAILVNFMDKDMEFQKEFEQIIGKNLEVALVAFVSTGEKYLFGSDVPTIARLVTEDLKSSSLLTKWGLYKPGAKELAYIPNSRKPDVVIYNKVSQLANNFSEYFNSGKKVKYLALSTAPEHPIHIIILRDENGVLHLVNTFRGPASEFIIKHQKNLIKVDPKEFKLNEKHFNNAFAVWGGLPFDINWFDSMIDGDHVHYR